MPSLAVLSVAVSGLVGPAFAAADPAPLWSDPITTTFSGEGDAGREILYTNPQKAGVFGTLQVINPDGSTGYQAEIDQGKFEATALAADGSGYVVQKGGRAGVVDAITADGRVRWSFSVPEQDGVKTLVAGEDGAAYIVLVNTQLENEELLRLSPVDGSVTFTTPLPKGEGVRELFRAPAGVAAAIESSTGNHALYFSQQGQIVADTAFSPSGNVNWFASNNTGEVFVGYVPAGSGGPETANGITISKLSPTGTLAWTRQTPNVGPGSPTLLAALPDGGVAYDVAGQSIGVLNNDGAPRWTTEYREGYSAMASDAAGHIDLVSLERRSCSDGVANCAGFAIDQRRAADGTVQARVSIVGSTDPSQTWFCGGFALGPGLFYALDRTTTREGDSPACGAGATLPQVQAYSLPNTAGAYPTLPATTEPGGQGPSSSYVALGDSFSSGEGNPPYEAGTDTREPVDMCHRSQAAYPPQLAKVRRALRPMVFKACSGAVTNDIFDPNGKYVTEPAQLAWLQPATKFVTLTLGGNDAGFAWLLQHCVSGGGIFPKGFGCSGDARLTQETDARRKALEGGPYATTPPPESRPIHSILSVIQAIHARSPSAKIFVGLYPTLFGTKTHGYSFKPEAPSGSACEVGNYHGAGLWIDYNDAQWLNKLGTELDATITKATSTAAQKGISVLPVTPSAFAAGHRFCDSRALWFHPLAVELSNAEVGGEFVPKPESFHPTATGQKRGYERAFAASMK